MDFTVYILNDRTALALISFEKSDRQVLDILDQVTSRAILHGGTLKTQTRAELDSISPYLAKRLTGHFNLPI